MMKRAITFLSGPVLLHYIMPVLIVYLIIGTVAQKYIGLYEASKIFFADPLLWLGPIPLPGLPILLGLVTFNLAFKLIFKSPWHLKNAGNIITHLGVMLLLVGGLFTALYSSEGYLDLAQDEEKAIVKDYHVREFVLLDAQDSPVHVWNHRDLDVGQILSFGDLPLSVEILEDCRNCAISPRENADESFQGMAEHMSLSPAEPRIEDEENMGGLTFRLSADGQDSVHVVLEGVPRTPEVTIGDETYRFALRKEVRDLPFSVQLLDFQRDYYPGTDTARSYSSRVLIRDGEAQWESLISMNEPLRYKGYTLYQSSFLATDDGDVTVLAVVWNAGRIFPYLSGIVLCIGITVHLFVRRRTKKKDRETVKKSKGKAYA